MSTDRPRRTLRRWQKALLGLAVTVAFFLALELVLAICGIRPVLHEEDPCVGFAGNVPLFVEHTTPDGRELWRTATNKRRLFNLQEFARHKPPGTVRIFCMGGSTTYGSPFDDGVSFCGWLRALLPVADPSRRWEVVNCGGLSYASYRVARLMQECARYEPDLFVVYCGHNEFLERRTYGQMLDAPGPLLRAATAVTRTRTGSVLKRGLDRLRRPRAERRTLLPAEVQAELDHTIGPEHYSRNDEWARQVVAHFRLNLHRMVDIAGAAGARVLFVTPMSNLRDCSPFKSQHRAGLGEAERQRWDALVAKAQATGDPAEALAALDQGAAIDCRHADLQFRRGRALYALGRYLEARTAFERAVAEDVCPLRATDEMRSTVAAVELHRPAMLVDFATLMEDAAPHGVPGKEHFLDHVHPTVATHRTLAIAIIEVLAHADIVRPCPGWNDAAVERVSEKVEARIDREAEGVALRNLAKVMGWAGKFEESRRLALQAIDRLGDDAESCFHVGVSAHVLGDADQALAYLRRAAAIDPGYGHAHLWLAEALAARGERDAAIAHYRRAVALLPDDPRPQRRLAELARARRE